MAILLTGDLHGERGIHRLDPEVFPEGEALDRNDYLIIVGDFQLVYAHGGMTPLEKKWLTWLSERPWTTLFIDGNHEHMPRLRSLPQEERFGGQVGRAADHVYYLQRGQRYEIDERSILCLGGAHSIDRHKRIPGETWFEDEIPNSMEVRAAALAAQQGPVDVLLSHTCPSDIKFQLPIRQRNDISDPTEHILADLRPLAQPRHWVFGHFHVNWKKYFNGIMYTCLFDEIALLDHKLGILPLGKKPMTRHPAPHQGEQLSSASSPLTGRDRLPRASRLPQNTTSTLPPPDSGFGTWGGE